MRKRSVHNKAPSFDLVIRGGRIVDGSGAPWYVADIGIRAGKIAKIGRIAAADGGTVIDAAGSEFDVRQREITIRHLLEHRGGWDRDKSFDAMFEPVRFAKLLDVPAPAGPREVIRAMLRQKLDFNPGERYAYSNFGYCLLGRVIEKLSGMTYEAYV